MGGNIGMDKIYDEYLASSDRTIEIVGTTYHKIIHKEKISLRNGVILICVPWKLFVNTVIDKVIDEYGRVFDLGRPVHYSFSCRVPEWYLNTVTVNVEDIRDIGEIGDYLAVFRE